MDDTDFYLQVPSLFNITQIFWSSEDRVKARFYSVESRQNKPKVNQKRWCSLFLLSLGKTQIYLVFLSLIRTSDLSVEGTSARKYKRKRYFSFVFLSLIRTFAI